MVFTIAKCLHKHHLPFSQQHTLTQLYFCLPFISCPFHRREIPQTEEWGVPRPSRGSVAAPRLNQGGWSRSFLSITASVASPSYHCNITVNKEQASEAGLLLSCGSEPFLLDWVCSPSEVVPALYPHWLAWINVSERKRGREGEMAG